MIVAWCCTCAPKSKYVPITSIVHKQMYCIRTNLRRFQPSNIKRNIRVLIFHYIIEYFSNLSCSCPLHEQLKDEIILVTVHVYLTAGIRRKYFAGNFNTLLPELCIITITKFNFMTKVNKINIR